MMQCSDVMKELVEVVGPDSSVADAAERMRDAGVGFLPVIDGARRVLGVLTDRDIALRVCAEHRSCEATIVGDIMSEELVACRPDDSLESAEREMIHASVFRVVVTDEDGTLRGVITLTDLAHYEDPLAASRVLRLVTSREFRFEGVPGRPSSPPTLGEGESALPAFTALHPGTMLH
jgi:CBS domain-containing protein